jgi:hypothetical protein
MLGNYRMAAQLVASRVVLSSTELVSYYFEGKQPFWAIAVLRRSYQTCLQLIQFSLLWISQQYFFFQSKVVSLAINSPPGGPSLCNYVPQLENGAIITRGTGFTFERLLRFAGIW